MADLEWAEPAPVLPLLTDRRRHGTPVLNFDRSAVKRALQHTQHDCHQWLSRSFRVHHVLGRDSAPDPAGEAYSAPPDPLAGLRGTLLIMGRGRGDGPLTHIPGFAPVTVTLTVTFILIIISSIPPPLTLSFQLKSFSANPSHRICFLLQD